MIDHHGLLANPEARERHVAAAEGHYKQTDLYPKASALGSKGVQQ
jgi:hypothetical protein